MSKIDFKSTEFSVIPHEDEELNPGILGKSLSSWIKSVLEGTDYPVIEFITEDFGYCLMVKRKPYWLWIGVSGSTEYDYPEDGLTEEIANKIPVEDIKWTVWVTTESDWLSLLLRRDNRKTESKKLFTFLVNKLKDSVKIREVLCE